MPNATILCDDHEAFDKELLLRLVKGIEVDWMERYANSPTIRLIGPADEPFDLFAGGGVGDKYPHFNSSGYIFYIPHPAGFVSYWTHSGTDRNEGGFGGADFRIFVRGEEGERICRGPWSSRASVVNTLVRGAGRSDRVVADVSYKGRYHIGTHIKWPALEFLLRHFGVDVYMLEWVPTNPMSEPSAITPSTQRHAVIKPSGMVVDYYGGKNGKYICRYDPAA